MAATGSSVLRRTVGLVWYMVWFAVSGHSSRCTFVSIHFQLIYIRWYSQWIVSEEYSPWESVRGNVFPALSPVGNSLLLVMWFIHFFHSFAEARLLRESISETDIVEGEKQFTGLWEVADSLSHFLETLYDYFFLPQYTRCRVTYSPLDFI